MSANEGVGSKVGRLARALKDPLHLFTRNQMVYLMATAARWGRESVNHDLAYAYEMGERAAFRHVAELNLAAIRTALDTPPFSATETVRDIARKQAREAWDTAARVPRDGDLPPNSGGVPCWDYEPHESRAAEQLLVELAQLPRVRAPEGARS